MNIHEEVQANAFKVAWFIEASKIPTHLFQYPDYFKVKAEDITDFERLVKEPSKERLIIDKENERRFSVVAKFTGILRLGKLGFMQWAEIEEPDPIEQTTGETGVQNLTFFFPKLDEVSRALGWRGLPHDYEDYGDHAELVVPIKNTSDYFRFKSELKPKYKTALLSNAVDEFIYEIIPKITMLGLFDEIIASFQVGMAKPDPELYKLTLSILGVKPNETIFIDDLEKHTIPAEDLGIKTIVYKNFSQMKIELEKITGRYG
jgi:FMN phosphatase YigB (HAD superfamily)